MKLKWPMKIKCSVLIVGILITLGSIGMVIYEGTVTHKDIGEKIVCTYERNEEMHYKVGVNSTKLYDQNIVPAGQYYVSNYVDSIVFSYVNTYVASVKAEITGQYKITTEFRGYAKEQGDEGEKKVTIWSKNEVIKDSKQFSKVADNYQINESITLDLKKYNSFIIQLQKEENLFMPAEVIIKIEGTEKVKLPKEEVEIPIFATATVPITEDYFKIDYQVGEKVDGRQTEEEVTILPTNHKRMVTYGIVGLLGLVSCIVVGFLVIDIDEEEKMARKIKGIYIEYGSRIIHVNHVSKEAFKNIYQLNSLEDCIKLADELEKPILIERGKDSKLELFIIENQNLYTYKLEAIDIQDMQQLEAVMEPDKSSIKTSDKLKSKVMTKVLEDEEDSL